MLDDGEQGPLEEVMKGRLNKALLTLVTVQFIALFVVLFLAYYAGAGSNGQSLGNFGSLPGPAGIKLLFAVVLCLGAGLVTWFMLSNRVMAPVKHLADFSEKLSHGDFRAKADLDSHDDFVGASGQRIHDVLEKRERDVIVVYDLSSQRVVDGWCGDESPDGD